MVFYLFQINNCDFDAILGTLIPNISFSL